MTARYIDAHCHVQFDQYGSDREQVLEAMQEQGISGVVVGCGVDSSTQAVMLAEQHKNIYASVGQHPNHLEPYDEPTFRGLVRKHKVVAVGECGLDYYRPERVDNVLKQRQQELFSRHIDLAQEFDKPLIIHARPSKGTMDAYTDLIDILTERKKQYPALRGDVHFFVGGTAEADALIALGFTVSFTAVITFAREYDEVIRHVPLEAILSETDSPYVAPVTRRGQRNDPISAIDVVKKIAEIREEDEEAVRSALVANAERVFAFSS